MSDAEWLKKWRVENAGNLSHVPAQKSDDHRNVREWDMLRFGLRQRFGDERLSRVTLVQERGE